MTNPYFTKSGTPSSHAPGASSPIRAEIAAIEAGFDKLPTLSGNALKLIRVNAGANGLEPIGTIDAIPIGATTPSTGAFTTLSASGGITGNLTGTVTGNVTGNATTATTLQTARNINGVSFNGSADITVTAAAGTLTGATLAAGVTASSLTSLGTLGSLSVTGGVTAASFTGSGASLTTLNASNLSSGSVALARLTLLTDAMADTSSASNGAGIPWINQTLNYVAGTIGAILNDVVHDPKAFPWLAKFDGTTDDTASIAACIAATANGTVLIPANAAKVIATIPVAVTCCIRGVSQNAVISTAHASNDVFQVSASGVTFENFQITSSVTRSGGYYINFNGSANANNYSRVHRMTLTEWHSGILLGGGGSTCYRLLDLVMTTAIAGGIGVVQSTTANAVDVVLRDALIIGPIAGSQCVAGVQIQNSGDTTLCRVSTVKAGIGLHLVPQSGQRVQALIGSDCYFDSGSGSGVQVNPAAGASVDLFKLSNSWVCTNANGVNLGPSGTGEVKRAELVGCTMSNHASGTGLTSTSVVTSLSVLGGSASANVNGASIGANQSGFSIIGLRCGAAGEFAANTGNGINIAAGTSNNYTIIGNDLRGNGGSALVDGGTGTTKYVYGNLGVNPGATGVVTVGASPFTRTAGGSPRTLYIAGGTVSNITISGQSTGIASGTFRIGPGQSLVVTYTVAPTMVETVE